MLRVVVDANVYVAAAITPNGTAAQVVNAGLAGEYEAGSLTHGSCCS